MGNSMTEEQQERLGFREWTTHYEKEQEADREKINALADGLSTVNSNLGRLTANVETLLSNQKGMFDRINRPTQWGVLVSAALLVAVILGLVTGPMKEEISDLEEKVTLETNRNVELHIMFNDFDIIGTVIIVIVYIVISVVIIMPTLVNLFRLTCVICGVKIPNLNKSILITTVVCFVDIVITKLLSMVLMNYDVSIGKIVLFNALNILLINTFLYQAIIPTSYGKSVFICLYQIFFCIIIVLIYLCSKTFVQPVY